MKNIIFVIFKSVFSGYFMTLKMLSIFFMIQNVRFYGGSRLSKICYYIFNYFRCSFLNQLSYFCSFLTKKKCSQINQTKEYLIAKKEIHSFFKKKLSNNEWRNKNKYLSFFPTQSFDPIEKIFFISKINLSLKADYCSQHQNTLPCHFNKCHQKFY